MNMIFIWRNQCQNIIILILNLRHYSALKQEFIRGNINKDQYEILKENIADVLKDLISKKKYYW
jgi:hypothetical protein